MIALLGIVGLVCLMVFAVCLALGTVAGDSMGALGNRRRGRDQAPETSYWSIR